MTAAYRIVIRGLSHSFDDRHFVLRDVNITVEAARKLCILGPNGSGKSTLLGIVAGLVTPSAGSATIQSEGRSAATPIIGLLHQDYRQSNWPWASALDNTLFPLRFRRVDRTQQRVQGIRTLSSLLPEIDYNRRAWQLSGGQQQLLTIARAITARPDVLLADEPLSAADHPRAIRAVAAVVAMHAANPFPCIWVSHNIDEALLMGDDFAVMQPNGICVPIGRNPIEAQRCVADLGSAAMVRLRAELLEALLSEPVRRNGGEQGGT